MRIAFLGDSLDKQYGGIHVFTKEVLKELTRLDSENEYLIIRAEEKNEYPKANEIAIPYSNFPGYRGWRIFYQIPKIISKKKVDVVIEPAHFGPFNLPAHIRRVTVIHDLTMYLFPEDHLFKSQFIQRMLLPRILRKADHIITNSTNTSLDLHRLFPGTKGKTTSISLGKSDGFYPGVRSDKVLEKYKITTPYILCVSTFEPRKNLPLLIRAFCRFKLNTGWSHQLILIGKPGWKYQPIFEAIDQAEFKSDIKCLGYVPGQDLPAFYRGAEVFVYPSKYEGFGLPVLEAMACGTPVLLSREGSLAEVGGEAAVYFSSDSEADLSEKLRALCGNEKWRASLKKNVFSKRPVFPGKKQRKDLKV